MNLRTITTRLTDWMSPGVTIPINAMNRIERWFLQKLVRRLVIQGWSHQANITEFYKVINDAARVEFNEDNKPTLDDFLSECHENSLGNFRSIDYLKRA